MPTPGVNGRSHRDVDASVGFKEDQLRCLTGTVPIAPHKTSLQDLQDLDLKDFRA